MARLNRIAGPWTTPAAVPPVLRLHGWNFASHGRRQTEHTRKNLFLLCYTLQLKLIIYDDILKYIGKKCNLRDMKQNARGVPRDTCRRIMIMIITYHYQIIRVLEIVIYCDGGGGGCGGSGPDLRNLSVPSFRSRLSHDVSFYLHQHCLARFFASQRVIRCHKMSHVTTTLNLIESSHVITCQSPGFCPSRLAMQLGCETHGSTAPAPRRRKAHQGAPLDL